MTTTLQTLGNSPDISLTIHGTAAHVSGTHTGTSVIVND